MCDMSFCNKQLTAFLPAVINSREKQGLVLLLLLYNHLFEYYFETGAPRAFR